jgi:hypothetical protein
MHPRALDFNPHYFDNPTLYYYMAGGAAFLCHLAGWISINSSQRFYFEHPEHVARLILAGRVLSVLFALATVWLMYRLARRWGLGRGGATFAALLLAVHPSHVLHSHYMTCNAAVTFWVVLALLFLDRWVRRGGTRAAILAGAVIGLAATTKYTGGLLVPLCVLAGLLRWRRLAATPPVAGAREPGPLARSARECCLALAACVVVFFVGTPYLLLGARETQSSAVPWMSFLIALLPRWGDIVRSGLPFLWTMIGIHLAATGPFTLLAALVGLWVPARGSPTLRWLALAFLGAFFLIALRMGTLATDSRFLPMYPVLVLLAAVATAELFARRRFLGTGLAVVLVVSQTIWTIAVLGAFHGPQPRQLASEWARANLPGRERILMSGFVCFGMPDLPWREMLQHKPRWRDSYERQTQWEFVAPDTTNITYPAGRALNPDVVFLWALLPLTADRSYEKQWLADRDYQVVASFPGKVRLFGRRVHAPLDNYDCDLWVLRRSRVPAVAHPRRRRSRAHSNSKPPRRQGRPRRRSRAARTGRRIDARSSAPRASSGPAAASRLNAAAAC